MKKINNHFGFSAIEGLLIIIIVGFLGFTGWFVYNSSKNAKNTLDQANKVNNSSVGTSVTTYKRTTTVPPDWKKYSNSNLKFNYSYTPSWTNNVSTGASKMYATSLIEVDASNATGKSIGNDGMTIYVFKQSLSQTLAIEQKNANTINGNNTTLQTSSLTYDGHPAMKFKFPVKHSALNTVYIISANGYTYDVYLFSPHGDNSQPISQDTLTAFESLKF